MNRFSIFRSVGVLAAVVLLAAGVSFAQTASVSGTATDSTGAVVPGVAVAARNTQTGSIRSTQTGDTGFYRLTALVPGTYEVSFEKSGFSTLRYTELTLTVDQSLTLDAKLELSPVTQTVEVSGQEVAPIELDNAQISNIVDQRRVTDLPLILRNPYTLVLLSPGSILSQTRLGGFAINGQSEKHNNFLLDGVDNNDTDVPGIPAGITAINPDSTQEFRIITNNFAPEFGRNAGAVIDIVTRGGTNTLHGGGYWFGRYAAQSARDFFNPPPDPKAPFVRNLFGGSAGGPLIKDKTFWFANYEGARFVTTVINSSTVPTAAFKTGIFSFNGVPVNIGTPSSPNNAAGLPLDPTIQKILALYPAANGSAVDDVRGILHFPSASRQNTDNFTIRVDHNLTSKHVLSGRYVFNRFKDPNAFHTDFLSGLDAIGTFQRTQNLSLGLTSAFTPNAINEFRFGGNRTNLQFNCGGLSVLDSFSTKDVFGRGRDFTLPGIAGFGCLSLGDSNGQARFTGTYTWKDTFTRILGRHTLKFGGEFRPVYSNSFNDFSARESVAFDALNQFNRASINLDPANPCNPNSTGATFLARCGSRTLQNMGWMLFGFVSTQSDNQFFDKNRTRTANDLRGFRQREVGVFFQDTFKVWSNFTLTYGLRWEFFGAPFEVNDNFSNLFTDPSGPGPFTFSVVGPHAGGQVYRNDMRNWEPRVGIAWDPFKKGKTSIRGGYGIFHDRIFGNLFGNARANPPFEQSPFLFIAKTLPNVPPISTVATTATLNNGDFGAFFVLFDPNFRMPFVQAWNFGIEQEVLRAITFEINYVGQHGMRLFRDVDGNPPQPATVAALIASGVPPSALQFTTARVRAANNTALFEPLVQKSIASSTYNGFQLKVTKPMTHGLQVQGSFTWSHSIDNASDPIDPTSGNRGLPRNSFNLGPERGDSDFDVRRRMVINFIYEIPVGRGKSHWNGGFVGRVFEGWQFAGIYTVSDGIPFDVFGNRDNQHTGLSDRADLVGNPSIPPGAPRTETGPPISAFALAPFGRSANLARNVFKGPGANNFDSVLQKTTSLTERIKFDLRFEFYNMFNRVQFAQPGNNIANQGTFGKSNSELTRPDGTTGSRQIQFAAKLRF